MLSAMHETMSVGGYVFSDELVRYADTKGSTYRADAGPNKNYLAQWEQVVCQERAP